jgi:hypothetical protein
LAVGHYQVDFGFALDGIDDVGGTERNVKIGYIVLMEKGGAVGGDAHAENADVFIFEDEVVMGLFGDGNGDRRLGVQGKCQKQQRGAQKRFH